MSKVTLAVVTLYTNSRKFYGKQIAERQYNRDIAFMSCDLEQMISDAK